MPRHHAANAARSEQFDGNIPSEAFIMCTKDHPHAAGTDLLQETIASQHSSGMLNRGGHRKACGNRRMEAAEKQSKARLSSGRQSRQLRCGTLQFTLLTGSKQPWKAITDC